MLATGSSPDVRKQAATGSIGEGFTIQLNGPCSKPRLNFLLLETSGSRQLIHSPCLCWLRIVVSTPLMVEAIAGDALLDQKEWLDDWVEQPEAVDCCDLIECSIPLEISRMAYGCDGPINITLRPDLPWLIRHHLELVEVSLVWEVATAPYAMVQGFSTETHLRPSTSVMMLSPGDSLAITCSLSQAGLVSFRLLDMSGRAVQLSEPPCLVGKVSRHCLQLDGNCYWLASNPKALLRRLAPCQTLAEESYQLCITVPADLPRGYYRFGLIGYHPHQPHLPSKKEKCCVC